VNGFIPILLFALAGLLMGGTWSLYKQGSHKAVVVVMGVLSLLAAAGGVAWLMPGEV
jgi:hypothetical protein